MKMLFTIMMAAALIGTAEEIPLANGRKIKGKVVGTVPAKVKIKMASGTVVDINVNDIDINYCTKLPEDVSEPYKLLGSCRTQIESLLNVLNVATNQIVQLQSIAQTITDQNARLIEKLQNETSPGPGFIEVSPTRISWRVAKSFGDSLEYSWQIKTNIKKTGKYDIALSIYDKDGFVVDSHRKFNQFIQGGGNSLAGTGFISSSAYNKFSYAKALIESR